MWPGVVTNFFAIKPTRCTNFTNLFSHETLRVSDSSSVQGPSWSCLKAVYKSVWYISLLSVQWINSWWWTEELSETCRFSWQNKICEIGASSWFYYKEKKKNHRLLCSRKWYQYILLKRRQLSSNRLLQHLKTSSGSFSLSEKEENKEEKEECLFYGLWWRW
jgi:hypothetical protein